jgi:hypothetical protein
MSRTKKAGDISFLFVSNIPKLLLKLKKPQTPILRHGSQSTSQRHLHSPKLPIRTAVIISPLLLVETTSIISPLLPIGTAITQSPSFNGWADGSGYGDKGDREHGGRIYYTSPWQKNFEVPFVCTN